MGSCVAKTLRFCVCVWKATKVFIDWQESAQDGMAERTFTTNWCWACPGSTQDGTQSLRPERPFIRDAETTMLIKFAVLEGVGGGAGQNFRKIVPKTLFFLGDSMTIKFGNSANFVVRNFVVIWEPPNLQESPSLRGPKSQKKVSKRVFLGVCKNTPEMSKTPQNKLVLGVSRFNGREFKGQHD